jgi:hypothetical protein
MEKAIRPIFFLLVIVSIIDFWCTKQLITKGGFEVESNPLLYHWMVQFNTSYVILGFKIATLVIFGVALAWVFTLSKYQPARPWITKATVGVTVIQSLVTALGAYMVLFM